MTGEGATPAAILTSAIHNIGQTTGASFNDVLANARIEPNLAPAMRMGLSSASGPFQFIDQT